MARVAAQLTNFTGGELSPRLDGRNDLTKYSSLYIANGIKIKKIHKKTRIGISRGTDKKWNFSINPHDYF